MRRDLPAATTSPSSLDPVRPHPPGRPLRTAPTVSTIPPAAPTSARLLHAAAAIDASGVVATPAALVIRDGRVVDVGTPESIGAVDGAVAERLADDEVIVPPLVNAHTHLDLTHLGCARHDREDSDPDDANPGTPSVAFTVWAERIRAGRLTIPAEIAASVHLGIALSVAGGVAAVGDIAGARSLVPVEALRHSPLRGVSYVEVFGQGRRQDATIEFMDHLLDACEADEDGVRVGLQPHAPYSCGPRVYAHAAELGRRLGLPLATHLAETSDEIEFVRRGTGHFVDMLKRIGVWDETILGSGAGVGAHPIDAVERALGIGNWIVAHANRIEPRHVEMLAERSITVAFCPRAHRYFGHHRDVDAPHRWREMIAAGVPVAIATDGLPCVDSPDRLAPLDDARMLFAEGGIDAGSLLAAITTVPAAALGLDPNDFLLRGGCRAGLVAIRCDSGRIFSAAAPLMAAAERPGSRPIRWLTNPWMQAGAATYDCGFPRADPRPEPRTETRSDPRTGHADENDGS